MDDYEGFWVEGKGSGFETWLGGGKRFGHWDGNGFGSGDGDGQGNGGGMGIGDMFPSCIAQILRATGSGQSPFPYRYIEG